MTSLINDNLFLVLLIFGGVLVCIRAHELYSTPAPRNDAQWLVDEMHLRYLTGNRQFATGFTFYLMPILLMYVLLSLSPEILSVSMGIAGTTNSVGALSLSGSDAHTFAPMLAATAVITLLSVKPFSILEHAIRRASHGIAGIPQHVQDIIRQIRQLDFRSMDPDASLPKMQADHIMAIPGMDNDLTAISTLDDWIFGNTGMLVWSDKANQALQMARQRILTEYDALKRKLALQHAEANGNANGNGNGIEGQAVTDKALDEIVRQSRELRIQFTRLLAVLIANQDEPLPERVASQPLWELVDRAQRKRMSSRHINILAASTLLGVFISVLFASLYNFTVIIINDLSLNNAAIDIANGSLHLGGNAPGEFYQLSFIYAIQAACWDVFGVGLLFFTGCSTALIYRAARVNSAEWELWHTRSRPVFQYLIVALLACLTAGLFYEVFLFVKLVVLPSLQVRNSGHFASMLRDFGSDYVGFGLLALVVAPSAVMVCRLSDYFGTPSPFPAIWRDSWIHTLSWSVGLSSMVIYLLVRLRLGEIHALSDVLLALVVPGGALFIMSATYWRIGEMRPRSQVPHDERVADDIPRMDTSERKVESDTALPRGAVTQ